MIKKYIIKIKNLYSRLNLIKRIIAPIYPNNPVFIFHHMPKCGGTSLINLLDKWFVVIGDYRKDWKSSHKKKVNTSKLRSIHCLAGHWELPEVYVNVRYPEVFENDRFKIFTFLRDPP